jgi:hypothetical protein
MAALCPFAGEDLPKGENQGDVPRPVATVKPHRSAPKGEVVLLTEKQLGYINKLVAETKTDVKQLLGFFGFDALENIPKADVNRVIRVLEQNRHKEAA